MTGAESETQRRPNLQTFLEDPDVWLVSSIERYDEETDTAEPGSLFTDRVIQAPSEPEIHSVHDTLAVYLHEAGRVEPPIVAELMGQSEEAVTSSIFLEPSRSSSGRPVWVTSDEYLSGAVRIKLAEARELAMRATSQPLRLSSLILYPTANNMAAGETNFI